MRRRSLLPDRSEAGALSTCTSAAELPTHKTRIEENLKSSSQAENLLHLLLTTGLLASKASLLEAIAAQVSAINAEAPAPPVLCIPTKNRPWEFRRALHSYAVNARHFGRAPTFTIIDYSDDSIGAENEETCRRTRRTLGVSIAYFNMARIRDLVAGLSRRAGVKRDTLRFALGLSASASRQLPIARLSTHGSVRNAVLLVTAGKTMVTVDDDTECVTALPEPRDDSLRLLSPPVPLSWSFKQSKDAINLDFMGAHEAVLGLCHC